MGVPLLAALLLAPHPPTLVAGCSVMAAFGAFNAFGRFLGGREGAREIGLAALGVALALATLAVLLSTHPIWLLGIYVTAAVAGSIATLAWRGRHPRRIAFEVAAIGGCAMIGAGIAAAAGAETSHALVVAIVLTTWGTWSLWWVRGQLARLLPRRVAWSQGRPLVVGLSLVTFAAGVYLGHPFAAALPLLYPLRTVVHAPVRSPGKARVIGLTELGWALGIAGLAVVL